MTPKAQAFLARLRGDAPEVASSQADFPEAIYNERDPFACGWIRGLIEQGLIPAGRVLGRDIRSLSPEDLAGPGQRHLFAGIAGWGYAFRLAGIPDSASAWSASCPCQPFSDAGEKGGFNDDRHLWPTLFELIRECRPKLLVGEQVASPLAYKWLDLVYDDLEGAGYTVGAAVLPAASAGAPHGRHRIFFGAFRVANPDSERSPRVDPHLLFGGSRPDRTQASRSSTTDGARRATGTPEEIRSTVDFLANPRCLSGQPVGHHLGGAPEGSSGEAREQRVWSDPGSGQFVSELANPGSEGRRQVGEIPGRGGGGGEAEGLDQRPLHSGAVVLGNPSRSGLPLRERLRLLQRDALVTPEGQAAVGGGDADLLNPWRDLDYVSCRDGTFRPVVSRSQLLAHGLPPGVAVLCPRGTFSSRTGLLRGFGNAIVPPLAAVFLRAFLESTGISFDAQGSLCFSGASGSGSAPP